MRKGKALALTLLTPIDIEIEMKNTIRSELLMTLAVRFFRKSTIIPPNGKKTWGQEADVFGK